MGTSILTQPILGRQVADAPPPKKPISLKLIGFYCDNPLDIIVFNRK